MKEELLAEFTGKLLEYANSVEIFAAENVPLYVEELLRYRFYEHLAKFAFPLSLFILVLALALMVKKSGDKRGWADKYDSLKDSYLTAIEIIAVLFIVTAVVMLVNTRHIVQAVKIKAAPRVYVIDYLRGERK